MSVNQRVIEEARRWIGTPYRHQGCRRDVGCDCLGLIRGVWTGVYGRPTERPPTYAMDWNANARHDLMAQAAHRHFRPKDRTRMRPGDLLLFTWKSGHAACHAGILFPDDHFVHAYERAGVVCSPLIPHWRRRITGVFRFMDRPEEA